MPLLLHQVAATAYVCGLPLPPMSYPACFLHLVPCRCGSRSPASPSSPALSLPLYGPPSPSLCLFATILSAGAVPGEPHLLPLLHHLPLRNHRRRVHRWETPYNVVRSSCCACCAIISCVFTGARATLSQPDRRPPGSTVVWTVRCRPSCPGMTHAADYPPTNPEFFLNIY